MVKYSSNEPICEESKLFLTVTNDGTKFNKAHSWPKTDTPTQMESAFFKTTVSKFNLKAPSSHLTLRKCNVQRLFFLIVSLGFDWDRQIGRLPWWKCKGLQATGHRSACHVWRNTSRLENPRKCWWTEYWSIESIVRNLLDWVAAITRL